jgi:hypothetical protein
MVNYIKYTPDVANNWSRAWSETEKQRPWAYQRLSDSSTISQLQSKLWIASELEKLNLHFKKVAIIGGWFAQYITPLLIDNLNVDIVHNYDIDKDAQIISYKFNRRYKEQGKYQAFTRNVFIKPFNESYDMIINTSCEHMYYMKKIKQLNPTLNSIYVLQSTNDNSYEDHINCVTNVNELAEQGNIKEIYFTGSKVLDNGMTRFMVIGK